MGPLVTLCMDILPLRGSPSGSIDTSAIYYLCEALSGGYVRLSIDLCRVNMAKSIITSARLSLWLSKDILNPTKMGMKFLELK